MCDLFILQYYIALIMTTFQNAFIAHMFYSFDFHVSLVSIGNARIVDTVHILIKISKLPLSKIE